MPAFSVMRELDIDHLQFWTEHCVELTRKFVEQPRVRRQRTRPTH